MSDSQSEHLRALLVHAAEILQSCTGLLIAAGAGMGVDSGLPDFRGKDGFWWAYPALAAAGIDFFDIATPRSFVATPETAWGFYGHRLKLYRDTEPHAGFQILRQVGETLPDGYFVYTSNVDGHFQKAGFDADRIHEVHGSIHGMQCLCPCSRSVWSADDFQPDVDVAACRLKSPLPRCCHCGSIARPNILMFDDMHHIYDCYEAQHERMSDWRQKVELLAIIELGAGTTISTVRVPGEMWNVPLVRVNPREWQVRRRDSVGLPMGALKFLSQYISIAGRSGA